MHTSITVDTEWGEVRIKVGISEGEVINAAPEHEDCKAIAQRRSVPLKQVMQAALSAYHDQETPR